MAPTRCFIVFCILAIAILPTVWAQEADDQALSRYQVTMYMAYNKVLVESAMRFNEPQTANISIELPLDAGSINNEIDGFEFPAILEGNRLQLVMVNNTEAGYYYITGALAEKDSFIASLDIPYDVEKMRLKLYLPEKAVLDRPIRKGAISGSSIYPRPTDLETDGQVIIVVWDFENLKQGENLDLFVRYTIPFRYWPHLIIGMILAILSITGIAYMATDSRKKRRSHPKIVVREIRTPDHESDISDHLKEDEQQILNILKMKEGSCDQGTLRVITGFSKAKLSGLLKELEERKVIHKEKRGKKNLVFLKKR